MATVRAIVNGAFEDTGITGEGETPSDAMGDTGLELLKSLYRHLIVAGTLGQMTGRLVTADYEAGENERVMNSTASAVTITLPTTVEAETTSDATDSAVDTANRQPRHLSVVEVVADTPDASIYDAAIGAWVSVDGLTLNSTAPLGISHRMGIQSMLAVRLCSRFQVPVPDGIANEARAGRAAMISNWHAPRMTAQAEYF